MIVVVCLACHLEQEVEDGMICLAVCLRCGGRSFNYDDHLNQKMWKHYQAWDKRPTRSAGRLVRQSVMTIQKVA